MTLHHSFCVDLANEYGIEIAIVINHFQYWIRQNKALGINLYDNRTWIYQSYDQIIAHFPYWSKDQVRRIIKKCVQMGILVKGKYNDNPYNQTIWYAFNDELKFGIINISKRKDLEDKINSQIDVAKSPHARYDRCGEIATCTSGEIATCTSGEIATCNVNIINKYNKENNEEGSAPSHKISLSSKKVKKSKDPQPDKILFHSNIYLTQLEFDKLLTEYGNDKLKEMMSILEAKIGSNGYEYKSHYHVLLPGNWVHSEYEKMQTVKNNLKRSGAILTTSTANSPVANMELANKVLKIFGEYTLNSNKNRVRIEVLNSYLEIDTTPLSFNEKGFKDQLVSILHKKCMPLDKIKQVEKL